MKNPLIYVGAASIFIALMIGTAYYSRSTSREDFKVQELNTSSKNALVSNLDYSSRITEGTSFFDQETFESSVRSDIRKNFKQDSTIKFTYLKEFSGTIKSVRVVVNEGKNTYQTTLLTNVSGGKEN